MLKLHHGQTLTTSDLRKAGVTGQLPKPEQYHPTFTFEQDGRRFEIAAPTRKPGCGRTLFFNVWYAK